jgi:hypothetical protein
MRKAEEEPVTSRLAEVYTVSNDLGPLGLFASHVSQDRETTPEQVS